VPRHGGGLRHHARGRDDSRDVGAPLANIRLALEHDARCKVVLDTEFLGFYGQLEQSVAADWLWVDGAVRHIHLKDSTGG